MRYTILGLCLVCLLGACGVKPSDVEPPKGLEKNTYPQTYPNPKYDAPSQ